MAADRVAAALVFLGALAGAQEIRVYSEFTRVDPFGNIVSADRGAPAREILSPAVPRNANSTFRVVVSGPAGLAYSLSAGENPENATGLEMYREVYVKSGDEWIPDGLERVALPYESKLGSADIPGQTAQSFLMDLRVERDAPVRRIKVEPQAWMDDRWVTYPMEVRVVRTVVPPGNGVFPPLPAVAQPSDAAVAAVYRAAYCEPNPKGAPWTPSARTFIARNANQDVLLARGGRPAGDSSTWCAPYKTHQQGPEWYLHIRDGLRRARE